jgi:DNA-binding transcriptional MocR family regulator
VTVGAQNALWIAIQLLLGPGRHAVCEKPGPPDIFAALTLSGAEVTTVEVDGDGLPPSDCRKKSMRSSSPQATKRRPRCGCRSSGGGTC